MVHEIDCQAVFRLGILCGLVQKLGRCPLTYRPSLHSLVL